MHEIEPEELVGFSERKLSSERSESIEKHLGSCGECRAFLSALAKTRDHLQEVDPALQQLDLREAVLQGLASDQPVIAFLSDVDRDLREIDVSGDVQRRLDRKRPLEWRTALLAAGALAASLVVVVVMWPIPEFQERAAASGTDSFVGFQPYLVEGRETRLLPDQIPSESTLAFSYSNDRTTGPSYAYVMIVAVDSSGHAIWYYPAPDGTPDGDRSLAIVARVRNQELPDQVESKFSRGSLTLFGIFSHAALERAQIERLISEHKPLDRLSSPDVFVTSRKVQVY